MDLQKKLDPNFVIRWGLAGMFFFLPVATSPTVICGAAVIAVWIISGRFLSDLRSWWRSDIGLPVLLMMLLPWVGLIYTPVPEDGISLALKSHYWLYAIVVPPAVLSEEKPDRVIKMFLAGLAFNSAVSLLQFAGAVPLKKGAATGLLGGSSAWIAFSLLLTTGILLASFYFSRSGSKKERALYFFLMVLYFIVLGFIGGRSGYIALIVLSPFVVSNVIGRRHNIKILVVCIAGVAILFASPVVRSRFAKAIEDVTLYKEGDVNTSLGLRFHMWEIAWNEIKKNPLLGVGTAGFKKSWEVNKKDASLPFIFHPHNSFIFMQVSYGILGLAAFCRLLWIMARKGWKCRSTPLGFAVFAFTVTYIIGSLSDTQVIVFATAVALPLFAGISGFLTLHLEDGSERQDSRSGIVC